MTALGVTLFALVACHDQKNSAVADSELAHDLALVNQPQASPQFNDTALSTSPEPRPAAPSPKPRPTRVATGTRRTPTPTPAPSRRQPTRPAPAEAPAPTPAPAPAPRTRGFRTGTSFGLATKSAVCTTNLPGDKLVATVTETVTGDNGAVIPAGTTVVLEVASVTPGDTPAQAQIGLRVRSILLNDEPVSMEGDVAVVSDLERRQVPRDKNSDRRKVVGGAIAGAVLGQILGKDTKSTVIGAAAGAAAGTAAAAMSRKYDACLPAGATVRVTTSQPITLSD